MFNRNDRNSYDTPQLTHREMEVLSLAVEGYTSKQTGDILFISNRTVDFHKSNLYVKLNVTGLFAAFHRATALGLLPIAGAARG